MRRRLAAGLLFVEAELVRGASSVRVENVLVDTGSVGTVFRFDDAEQIGLSLTRADNLHRIIGVGGSEFVARKRLEHLRIGEIVLDDVQIELGAMEHGFPINGIIGMNVLHRIGAVIDLAALDLRRG